MRNGYFASNLISYDFAFLLSKMPFIDWVGDRFTIGILFLNLGGTIFYETGEVILSDFIIDMVVSYHDRST